MNKVLDETKEIYINNVIKVLKDNGKEHEVELTSRQKTLFSKYKKAQGFVRDNKPMFEGIDLYKVNEIVQVGNGQIEVNNNIVNESDDEYIKKIEVAEKDILERQKLIEKEKFNQDILMKYLFGEIPLKIKNEFTDKLNIDKVLVGYKNGNEVLYCEKYNCIYEIIK
jgi:hypothetical protein